MKSLFPLCNPALLKRLLLKHLRWSLLRQLGSLLPLFLLLLLLWFWGHHATVVLFCLSQKDTDWLLSAETEWKALDWMCEAMFQILNVSGPAALRGCKLPFSGFMLSVTSENSCARRHMLCMWASTTGRRSCVFLPAWAQPLASKSNLGAHVGLQTLPLLRQTSPPPTEAQVSRRKKKLCHPIFPRRGSIFKHHPFFLRLGGTALVSLPFRCVWSASCRFGSVTDWCVGAGSGNVRWNAPWSQVKAQTYSCPQRSLSWTCRGLAVMAAGLLFGSELMLFTSQARVIWDVLKGN